MIADGDDVAFRGILAAWSFALDEDSMTTARAEKTRHLSHIQPVRRVGDGDQRCAAEVALVSSDDRPSADVERLRDIVAKHFVVLPEPPHRVEHDAKRTGP